MMKISLCLIAILALLSCVLGMKPSTVESVANAVLENSATIQQGSMEPLKFELDEQVNGRRTILKYNLKPLQPIYHITSTHHNLNSALNCNQNSITLTMKQNGISLMSSTSESGLKSELPTILSSGSFVVFHTNSHSCDSTVHGNTLLRRLTADLNLNDHSMHLMNGEETQQIVNSEPVNSWKDMYETGSVLFEVEDIEQMHPNRINNILLKQALEVAKQENNHFSTMADQATQATDDRPPFPEGLQMPSLDGSKHIGRIGGADVTVGLPTGSLSAEMAFNFGWNWDATSSRPQNTVLNLFTKEVKTGIASAKFTVDCLECYFGVKFGLRVEVNWDMNDKTKNSASITGTTTAPAQFKIQVGATGALSDSFQRTLGELYLLKNVLLFSIGPVPIFLDAKFLLEASGNLQFQGQAQLSVGFKTQFGMTKGISHQNGKTTPINQRNSFKPTVIPPAYTLESGLTGTIGMNAKLSLTVASIATIDLMSAPYMNLNGAASSNPIAGCASGVKLPTLSSPSPFAGNNIKLTITAELKNSVAAEIGIHWKFFTFVAARKIWPLPSLGPYNLFNRCYSLPLGQFPNPIRWVDPKFPGVTGLWERIKRFLHIRNEAELDEIDMIDGEQQPEQQQESSSESELDEMQIDDAIADFDDAQFDEFTQMNEFDEMEQEN